MDTYNIEKSEVLHHASSYFSPDRVVSLLDKYLSVQGSSIVFFQLSQKGNTPSLEVVISTEKLLIDVELLGAETIISTIRVSTISQIVSKSSEKGALSVQIYTAETRGSSLGYHSYTEESQENLARYHDLLLSLISSKGK